MADGRVDEVYIPGLGVFPSYRKISVDETLADWKSRPEMSGVLQYPAFAEWLAGYFWDLDKSGESFSDFYVGKQAAKFGVPKSVLGKMLGGGGGGGVNKADQIRSLSTSILNRSVALGMNLSAEEIDYIATVAQAQNFSSEQLDNTLVGMVNWDNLSAGSLTASKEEIDALSKAYLVGMSDETSKQWAEKVAKGQATPATIESYLRSQAKIMNPWLAEYIDQGLTPQELLQTSRDLIARNLEIDANTVDFMDDRFMSLATVTDDAGNTKLASQGQLLKNIRKDSAWAGTDQAKSTMVGTAQLIASIFGRSSF